jgi:fructoselysine-6-P-deglycase FrlB-like protein
VGREEISLLAHAADAVLIPAPGTVPGSREALVAELVDTAHEAGSLAVATVGTSQEGSDPETVRVIALAAKRAGADVLHLGDAGVSGIAEPTNILVASLAIRGRRHTYRRMAMR